MKTLCKILLLAIICIAGATVDASAQRKRPDKTSSAKAYYGNTPGKQHYKEKKTTRIKSARSQSSKRVRAQAWNRKKYS